VVFVIQRGDARLFGPHYESDPEFGELLREVTQHGVEVYAYGCQVNQHEITLDCPLPVVLSRGDAIAA
jgi:DNA-binding sugar fermentation-stimulating protein